MWPETTAVWTQDESGRVYTPLDLAALATGATCWHSDQFRHRPVGLAFAGGTIGCSVGSDGLTVPCTEFELAGVGATGVSR